MDIPLTDLNPIDDEMGVPNLETVERINEPEMLVCGTYMTTNLKLHRAFLEEFYGLETVCHRPGALLIRDKGRQLSDGHRHGAQYWVWQVEETDRITEAQRVLNHWGVDVATKEDVNRAYEIGSKFKARWGLKLLQKPKDQHASWAFYLRDIDTNWFEIQWGERRSRLFAEAGGFEHGYDADFDESQITPENPVVRPIIMSHGTVECGGNGNASRRFYSEFLGITPREAQRSPAYGVGTNREWYVACLAVKNVHPQPVGNRWIYAVNSPEQVTQLRETALRYKEKYGIRAVGDVAQEKDCLFARVNDRDGLWWEFQWRDKPMGRWFDDEFAAGDVATV